MKTLIGAIALIIAAPVRAGRSGRRSPCGPRPAPGMDHGKHQQGKHDCKECCDKMKGKDGKMECMDKADAKSAAPAPSGHEGHEGHATNRDGAAPLGRRHCP